IVFEGVGAHEVITTIRKAEHDPARGVLASFHRPEARADHYVAVGPARCDDHIEFIRRRVLHERASIVHGARDFLYCPLPLHRLPAYQRSSEVEWVIRLGRQAAARGECGADYRSARDQLPAGHGDHDPLLFWRDVRLRPQRSVAASQPRPAYNRRSWTTSFKAVLGAPWHRQVSPQSGP